jgi:galactitol-specific phosphotransferase system IIC component
VASKGNIFRGLLNSIASICIVLFIATNLGALTTTQITVNGNTAKSANGNSRLNGNTAANKIVIGTIKLMEGLAPIAEGAKTFIQKRFPGKEVYIGLDAAVVTAHPASRSLPQMFARLTG